MKTFRFLILPVACLVFVSVAYGQAVIPIEISGKYNFQVANVYFEVDPSFGARISSFKIDNEEVLYGNKSANGYLWGSTFWHSPQSWGWPPSVTLDQGTYSGGIAGNEIVLRSAIDAGKSDLIFKKAFSASLSDTSVTIKYTMINKGSAAGSFAPWEVTRVPSGGISFFPMGEGSISGAFASQTELISDVIWYEHNNSDPSNQKFFCDGAEGWSAHVNESNKLFIKKFSNIPESNSASGEAEIELWYNGATSYIELENQGAFASIDKNDSVTWTMKWYLRNLPAAIVAEKGNDDLTDFVRRVVNTQSTGVIENTFASVVKLFPNPASENLTVTNLYSGVANLLITDVSGKVLINKTIENNEVVQLSGLTSGLYLYQINGANIRESGKLIIRK